MTLLLLQFHLLALHFFSQPLLKAWFFLVQERPGVGVYVKDLSSVTVSSAGHMERIMRFGNNNRRVKVLFLENLTNNPLSACRTDCITFFICFAFSVTFYISVLRIN